MHNPIMVTSSKAHRSETLYSPAELLNNGLKAMRSLYGCYNDRFAEYWFQQVTEHPNACQRTRAIAIRKLFELQALRNKQQAH